MLHTPETFIPTKAVVHSSGGIVAAQHWEAAEAGAACVHIHARDPETGRPDQSPEAFGPILQRIKQASNAVVNITTGGAPKLIWRRQHRHQSRQRLERPASGPRP